MNKNAKKLVKALRSGKYQQARNALRTPEGYCCLGVACDLYIKEHPEAKWIDTITGSNFREGDMIASSALPAMVREWLGMRTEFGHWFGGPAVGLANKNDNGSSFAEIADIIESEPDGLFV